MWHSKYKTNQLVLILVLVRWVTNKYKKNRHEKTRISWIKTLGNLGPANGANVTNMPTNRPLLERGGSVVSSVPCVRKVAGSNPTLAAT